MALRRHTRASGGCTRPSSRKKCRLLRERIQCPESSLHFILPPNSMAALQYGGEKTVRLVRGAVQLQIFACVQRNFLRRQNLARVQ